MRTRRAEGTMTVVMVMIITIATTVMMLIMSMMMLLTKNTMPRGTLPLAKHVPLSATVITFFNTGQHWLHGHQPLVICTHLVNELRAGSAPIQWAQL